MKVDEKIKKFEKMIADPRSTKEEIALYKNFIEKIKASVKDDTKKVEKTVKKEVKKVEEDIKPKKDDKKPAAKKAKVEVVSTKRVKIDGKDVEMDSKEFCDYLLGNFKKRQDDAAKRKAAGKKTKTASVMSKVSDKIEKGVEQAIKSGVKAQATEISKDPSKFLGKVEKLKTSTQSFLKDLKEVMGSEYDSKEVTDTVKAINGLIGELKERMEAKKK
jgi:hypothetical protein